VVVLACAPVALVSSVKLVTRPNVSYPVLVPVAGFSVVALAVVPVASPVVAL